MNIFEILACIDNILHECSHNGCVFQQDVAHVVQNLGGDPNVIYNTSDATTWMTYMNTLAIRYLLQENSTSGGLI